MFTPTLRCECAQPASYRLMRKWCINQNIPPSIFLSKFQTIFTRIQDKKQTNKKVGNYNSLLTHFICRVIMILSIPVSETMGTGMGTMT